MERDFLALTLGGKIKEEASFEIGVRNQGTPWKFSNKASGIPHLLSFQVSQEKFKRNLPEPYGIANLISPSSSYVGDLNKMNSFPDVQRYGSRRERSYFSMKPHPVQQGFNPRSQIFPKNDDFGASKAVCFPSQGHVSTFPVTGANAGSTDSTQLTIFFGGTVNVYDGITPEKAQAIMSLACEGSSSPPSAQPREQFPPPPPKQPALETTANVAAPLCSVQWSRMSPSSQTGSLSTVGPTSSDETIPIRSANMSSPPAPMILSLPQARNASLARFLKKRNERVMSAAPYTVEKKLFKNSD